MPDSLVRTSDGKPLGRLANYSLNLYAAPVDPRDGSAGVPNFNVTVADLQGDTRTMAEMPVTLKDWTGYGSNNETRGTVVSPKASGTGNKVSLDCSTIFEKLNSEQTTLPILQGDALDTVTAESIRQMCLMAGVPEYSVEGNLLHYISKYSTIGYMANSIYKWRFFGPTSAYISYGTTENNLGGYANPIEVNLSQSVTFGVRFEPSETLAEFRIPAYHPGLQSNVWYTVRRVDNTWELLEKVGAAATVSKKSVAFTPAYPTDALFLFVQIKANAASDKIDVTFRFMEWDYINQRSVYSDNTTTGIVSTLRDRPLPSRLEVGYNTSLTAGRTIGYPQIAFIVDSPALQANYPQAQIAISNLPTAAKLPDHIPGFTGNIWSKLRELCAIADLDMIFTDDRIWFRSKELARNNGGYIPAQRVAKSNVSETTEAREGARSVEVVYRERLSDVDNFGLMYKADSVFSLEKGETKVETVQTGNTFIFLEQPVPVSGVPVPYTSVFGSYVVTGADGFIVDPQWWKDNGGSITVASTGKSGEIKITMQAPTVDTVRAPYRISEGVADRPALYITGYGLVLGDEQTMKVFTGNSRAAQDVGVTFDSPFLTKKLVAMNTAHRLAAIYGSANSKLTLRTSKANYIAPVSSADPATPISDCIYWKGSYYRVTEQSVTPTAIDIRDAQVFNTIGAINGEYATGKTIADWNALHAGKTIREVNIAPLPKYES